MGDRANIRIQSKWAGKTYFYSHWGGTELPEVARKALARNERWDDEAYLAAIIARELLEGDYTGTTGYGISATVGDGNDRVLVIDTDTQTVSIVAVNGDRDESRGTPQSFTDFAKGEGPLADWDG